MVNWLIVGGGLVRPEVRTFVNLGRVTSINAERDNLGTDKSVPYKHRATPTKHPAIAVNRYADLSDFKNIKHGFTQIYADFIGLIAFSWISPLDNPRNP